MSKLLRTQYDGFTSFDNQHTYFDGGEQISEIDENGEVEFVKRPDGQPHTSSDFAEDETHYRVKSKISPFWMFFVILFAYASLDTLVKWGNNTIIEKVFGGRKSLLNQLAIGLSFTAILFLLAKIIGIPFIIAEESAL
jgi:hypothetical protein